jgi:putative copper export protein
MGRLAVAMGLGALVALCLLQGLFSVAQLSHAAISRDEQRMSKPRPTAHHDGTQAQDIYLFRHW